MAKKKIKDEKLLKIEGSLSINEALEVHKQIIQAFEGADDISFELTGVTDCDTAGVQLIFSILKSVEESGKNISIPDFPKAVQDAAGRIGLEWGLGIG
jgi:ABC-type transporter Mla MlaB component